MGIAPERYRAARLSLVSKLCLILYLDLIFLERKNTLKHFEKRKPMKIFIVGLGTICEPLARLFLEVKNQLGIEEVIIHKNTPELQCRGMLTRFHQFGARLAVFENKRADFGELVRPAGFGPAYTFEEALERADVVIDCTKEKVGRQLKEKYYQHINFGKKCGFIAQGSEKGFGKPYAYGINDDALVLEEDRFIQVVSCNTHQLLCILQTLVLYYEGADNLVKGRFHLDRRASDISQTESTVGVEVGSPIHQMFGSHQGEDAARVLATLAIKNMNIHTTADKLNNPFMHTVGFDLTLKKPLPGSDKKHEAETRFRVNPLTAVTYLQTNNEVFGEGRDWGHFGRILNQTVVCLPSLEVLEDGHEVIGRCFTPQDGNALLSSVAATLWFMDPSSYRQRMEQFFHKLPFLFDEV